LHARIKNPFGNYNYWFLEEKSKTQKRFERKLLEIAKYQNKRSEKGERAQERIRKPNVHKAGATKTSFTFQRDAL